MKKNSIISVLVFSLIFLSLPINALALPGGILKYGSRGDEVREVQSTLNSIGYPISADGIYGTSTKNSILNLQKKYKELSNDGIYGNKTRLVMEKLNGEKVTTINKANKDKDEKVAYLTFDDGPSTTVTPQVLDILAKNNIKATFFVLGSMAEQNPKVLNRIYKEGHAIGNHSYSHKYNLIYKDMDNFLGDINKADRSLKNILGEEFNTDLLRFPGGSFENYKQKYKTAAQNKGYRVYDWNALNGDSEGGKRSADNLISRLKETTKGQKKLIVLMHDTYGKETTAKALPSIIKYLKDSGYTFKKL